MYIFNDVCIGYIGNVYYLRPHWRCTGRRQGFHSYVAVKYTPLSNEHVTNVSHLPHHG